MLTREENETLTRVGPGTPAGELLRRYWHPVAAACELTDQQPTRFVRVLGEDLVLFKDKSAKIGLLADHCSHRGASLFYGRVEERGIACAYHGWLYDTQGNCLETPAEPADSKFYLTVKHRAHPVEKLMGFYWAYMRPPPAPPIRRRVNQVQVHVPIDDTHTRTLKVYFLCERDGYDSKAAHEPADYYVLQPGEGKFGLGTYPDAQYRMDRLTGQDVMAIETQGGIAP